MAGGPLISVQPEELTFQFELEKQCYCDLKVVNNTEHHVAFKVKTTSPRKYFVRPNTGIIQPWDNCVITVTLQAQRENPPDMQCKDKFLLQSTKVPPSSDVDEMPPDTFNKDGDRKIEELKLRVVYTTPPHAGSRNTDADALLTSTMLRDLKQNPHMHTSGYGEVHALQRAKEERDAALLQTKQLQNELEMLKRRRNRRADSGFSLTFAAFVALLGLLVGFLLNLTLSSPPAE